MKKAGIPAPEVLRLATIGAARVVHRDQERGSITQEKLADNYLVRGNPAVEISDVRRGVKIIKGGVVYDVGALYDSVGVSHVPKSNE